MIKRLTFSLLLTCLYVPCFSQERFVVRGRILDAESAPVPYCSVSILESRDSTILGGAVSDTEGRYSLHFEQAGRYLLCYDHLAGRLGVALTVAFLNRGWLTATFALTPEGEDGLATQGLRVPAGEGRGCMDWSERRLHLAGGAGRAVALAMLEADWLQRDPASRALWVTPRGAAHLARWLSEDVLTA